jgi:predicted FMN-binding regulatory protein PaiB
MYQPGHRKFEVEDPAALLRELCAVVPATLVTHGPDGFRASIPPMLFDPADGLELHITRLEAKAKLSQNRSEAGIDGAIDGLAAGSDRERAVAEAMRRRRVEP